MIKLTSEQFEEIKRLQEPEVFTEAQMNAWVEGLKDTLTKAEVDELDETEKAVVDEFNHEFTSFMKVQVISTPSESELSKGLKYDNFFIREKQVEWNEEIVKSEDGVEEKARTGMYLDTKLNREMNRVGLVFGEKVEKSEEDELEKGGEGSRGGKIIGHTKSGKPIYETKFTNGDILTVKDKNHRLYGKKVHVQSVNRATDGGALKQHSYLVGLSPKGNAEAIGESQLGFDKDYSDEEVHEKKDGDSKSGKKKVKSTDWAADAEYMIFSLKDSQKGGTLRDSEKSEANKMISTLEGVLEDDDYDSSEKNDATYLLKQLKKIMKKESK